MMENSVSVRAVWSRISVCDMVTRTNSYGALAIKTTIELTDELARKAKRFAARHGLTLRAVIEEGIRLRIAEPAEPPFVLRDASVGGEGLTPEFQSQDWPRLREAAYGSRGG